jgi:hypothetical protein
MSNTSHVGANPAKRSQVPGIPVGLVLELALNEEVGFIGADKSKSAPGSSVSNGTWKYRSSNSSTDTYVGSSFNRVPYGILPRP